MTDYDLYSRPFALEEHAFVSTDKNSPPDTGHPYILKSALRRRLNEIDKKWRLGTPQLMAVDADMVVMTGELIVEGACRTAVGTGKILNMRAVWENKKIVGYEPVSPPELTREKSKAFKAAASDLLPRLCLEYNIGAYMKELPKGVNNRTELAKWLDRLTPRANGNNPPATPPVVVTPPPPAEEQKPTPPPVERWTEQPHAFEPLVIRAHENGWIKHKDERGVKELESIIAPKVWADFADRTEAGMYIKEMCEDTQAEIERAKQTPPAAPRSGSLNANSATIEDRTAVFTTKGSMTLRVLIENLIAMLQPNGDARDNKKQERWLESVRPELWKDGQSVTFPELRLWFTRLRETNYALVVTSIDVAVDIPPTNGHHGERIPPTNGSGNRHYLTVGKVEYNGTLVVARTPAGEAIKCGTKEAFKVYMPVPVLTEQWTGTELVPEVYTLPASVRIVYERQGENHNLSGIELPQENQ